MQLAGTLQPRRTTGIDDQRRQRTKADTGQTKRCAPCHYYHSRAQTKLKECTCNLDGTKREGVFGPDIAPFFKSLDYRYKRLRKYVGKEPSEEEYEHKKACLAHLETLSSRGFLDLFYADESGISTEGYVPYGWMQRGEKIGVRVMPVSRQRLNCFGLLSRNGNFHYTTTEQKADSDFVIGWMDAFSLSIEKETVVVLDNAPIHKSKKMLAMKAEWQERGLHLFYLPPYSPHLNIIETLWRVLKGKWLEVSHYASAEKLFQAAKACLEEIGDKRKINFSKPT